MNRYAYATLDAASFLNMGRIPKPVDSYLSEDQDSQAVRMLYENGYRFVCISHDLALFEKPITPMHMKIDDIIAHETHPSALS